MNRRPWLSGLAIAAAILLGAELSLRAYFRLTRGTPAGATEIWAVGDSNTEGVGAPLGESYPQQLSALLKLKVLNLGVAGRNSSQALEELRSRLQEGGRPRWVLFLAGVSDETNVLGVDPDLAGGSKAVFAVRQALQSVRLLQALRAPLSAMLRPEGFDLLRAADYGALRDGRTKWRTRAGLLCLTAADVNAGDFAAARESLERALKAPAGRGVVLSPVAGEPLMRAELSRLAAMESGRPAPEFSAAEEKGPDASLLLFLLSRGWSRFSAGRLDEAASDFSRAAGLTNDGQNDAYAYEGLGWVELRRGHAAKARGLFDRAIAGGGGDTFRGRLFWARAGRIAAAAAQGEWRAAEKALDGLPPARPASVTERCAARWLRAGVETRSRRAHVFAAAFHPLCDAYLASDKKGRVGRDLASLMPVNSLLEFHDGMLLSPRVDPGFRRRVLDHNLERLAGLASAYGFQPFVLTYPQPISADLNLLLGELATAHGLPVIDLQGVLQPGDISGDGYHPNSSGYGRVARRIAETFHP